MGRNQVGGTEWTVQRGAIYVRAQRKGTATIAQTFVTIFVLPAFVDAGVFVLVPAGFVGRVGLVLLVRFVGRDELVLLLVEVVGSDGSDSLVVVDPGEFVVSVGVVGSGESEGTAGGFEGLEGTGGGLDGTLMLVVFPGELVGMGETLEVEEDEGESGEEMGVGSGYARFSDSPGYPDENR